MTEIFCFTWISQLPTLSVSTYNLKKKHHMHFILLFIPIFVLLSRQTFDDFSDNFYFFPTILSQTCHHGIMRWKMSIVAAYFFQTTIFLSRFKRLDSNHWPKDHEMSIVPLSYCCWPFFQKVLFTILSLPLSLQDSNQRSWDIESSVLPLCYLSRPFYFK